MTHKLFQRIAVAVFAIGLGIAISSCDSKPPTVEELAAMSVPQLEEHAARDNMDAVVELSTRYAQATGVEKDENKALELLSRAIAKDHPYGTFLMGVAHSTGLGVPQDDAKAVIWYERAANLGNVHGQYWLAFMIANGRGGIGANWEGAYPLMVKAAEQGHSDARFMLGYMFQAGLGVDQDFEQAAIWYRRASETQANQKAQFNLRGMINEGLIKPQRGDEVGEHMEIKKPLE